MARRTRVMRFKAPVRFQLRKEEMGNRIAIPLAIVSVIISTSLAQGSEVWVPQAHGRVAGSVPSAEKIKQEKSGPEGTGTAAATTNSPTNPDTCNQQNASSPACYSATQQTRSK